MNIRARKAAGGLGILLFLTVYVIAAVSISGHLPDNRAVQLIYFVVAGVAWGLPLIPLIKWMEKPSKKA